MNDPINPPKDLSPFITRNGAIAASYARGRPSVLVRVLLPLLTKLLSLYTWTVGYDERPEPDNLRRGITDWRREMSEYQYYEFQAVDNPLTRQQMSELRGYSSRAEITPTRFVNSYNFGSFKGNSEQWMERYFDAHLYFANWGTRILMLRIPERLLEEEALDEYCTKAGLSFYLAAESFILSFTSEVEDYGSYEGEGALSSILPVRSGLMRGDRRALYLGWLAAVQAGEVDDGPPSRSCRRASASWTPPLKLLAIFSASTGIFWSRPRKESPMGRRQAFPMTKSGRGCEAFRPTRRTRTSHALSKETILTSQPSFFSVLQGRGSAYRRMKPGRGEQPVRSVPAPKSFLRRGREKRRNGGRRKRPSGSERMRKSAGNTCNRSLEEKATFGQK